MTSAPDAPEPISDGDVRSHRGIPEATVARLPVYLRAITALVDRNVATASSEELAQAAGVNSAKLRKDLSYLGSYGTRGVGYDLEYLRYQIAREIGLTHDWPVIIIGIGNLGRALANYSGFASRGFGVVALLDADTSRVGERISDLCIRAYDDLDEVVAEHSVAIGVIATPATAAQDVCDRLVNAGVTSILNFAPVVLSVPDGVVVRKVDLSTELQILAYHEQRKAQADGRPGALSRLPAIALDDPAGDVGHAVGGNADGSVGRGVDSGLDRRAGRAAEDGTDGSVTEPVDRRAGEGSREVVR